MTPKERQDARKMLPLSDGEVRDAEKLNREMHAWLSGRRVRWAIGTVGFIVAGALLALLSAGVVRNVQRLDTLQGADRDGARTAGYRTCVRADVGRLELQLAARERSGDRSIARKRLSRVPILDCSPLRHSRGALPRPLKPKQQIRAVVFYAKTYRVPVIAHGHVRLCPDRADAQGPVTRWRHVPTACLRTRDLGD